MREVIHSSESVSQAKNELLEKLSLKEYETCEIEVVQEERKGVLGIGSREAQVKATVETNKFKKAEVIILEALKILNIEAEIKTRFNKKFNCLDLELNGEDTANFFQDLGQAKEDFEQLVNIMVNARDNSRYLKVRLLEPFKRNPAREQFLKNQAITLAKQVVNSKESIALPPMNPFERSIVHNAVKAVDGVMTQSEGSGMNRHVVIHPIED